MVTEAKLKEDIQKIHDSYKCTDEEFHEWMSDVFGKDELTSENDEYED